MSSSGPLTPFKEVDDDDKRIKELDDGFMRLLGAIKLGDSITRKEYMQLFTICHNLCTGQDRHELGLYTQLIRSCRKHVISECEALAKKSGDDLLKSYLETFSAYQVSCRAIGNISNILARFWIPIQKNNKIDVREMKQLCLVIWRDNLYASLRENLQTAIDEFVEQDRDNRDKDRAIMRNMINVYALLGLENAQTFYETEFEARFIASTSEYYLRVSTDLINKVDIATYMTQAQAWFEKEEEVCSTFYGQFSTTPPLVDKATKQALIAKHSERLQAEFSRMIEENRVEEMKCFYFLLSKIPNGLDQSAKTFEKFTVKKGAAPVKQQLAIRDGRASHANVNTFFNTIRDLYVDLDTKLTVCFKRDVLFVEHMDKGFTRTMNPPPKVVNKNPWNLSKCLASYADNILRGKVKEFASNEDKLDEELDRIVRIFSYIRDKDEFGSYTRAALCRRLLSTRGKFNETGERAFISKLKASQGVEFTRKIQGMLQDIADESVTSVNERFYEKNDGEKKISGVSLSVKVLNNSYWPIPEIEKFKLVGTPKEFNSCMESFESFYKEGSGKVLDWLWSYGSVDIGCVYRKRQYVVQVTPLQASIIVLFNDVDSLSFSEIMASLWPGYTPKESSLRSSRDSSSMFDVTLNAVLQSALHGISCLKFRILSKDGNPSDVSITDTFKFDLKFGKNKKIPFPSRSPKLETTINDDQWKRILKERQFEIDAAVVRVMKSRNRLTLADASAQVISILKTRFQPDGRMIKKRVESLIERNFLKRDKDDRKVLVYVA